jgi:glycosyltransferase involved in cell wall biosynthesis
MTKPFVSIIVPAYNEENIIEKSLSKIHQELISLKKPFEILVVDDGSKDRTTQILKQFISKKRYPQLRIATYSDGPSRRENLAKSFHLLKGKYIVLLDMDLSMDIRYIRNMIYWLGKSYDMVIPNRYHPSSKLKRNPKRYIVSKIYNGVIRILFQTGFQDNICGFKAFKRPVAIKLVKEAGIDSTRTRSVFWDTELLIRARQNNFPIKEIPVVWSEGPKSSLNFKRESKMVPYILKFWLASLSRKPR